MPRTTPFTLRRLAAVLTLAAAGAAGAAPPAGHAMLPFGGPGMGRLLDQVEATPEQRSQIAQITQAARADLRAQHEAGRSLREQSLQLFTQPTVDADAAEALRRQMLEQHDRASQRSLQAMLELSRVLTPEQRVRMAELATERMGEQMKQRRSDMPQRQPRERKGG